MRQIIFLLCYLLCLTVRAETLTVVIPFPPGGATDQIWRTVEPLLINELKSTGIKITTEYAPGAGGGIGAAKVANSKNVRLLFTSTSVAINLVNNTANYNAADLTTLGYFGSMPMFVAVPLNGPNTVDEFVHECRRDSYLYATPGVGSTIHLMSLEFLYKIKCSATNVPYKSTTPALPDLMAGRLHFVVDFSTSATADLVSQGKLKHLTNLNHSDIKNWHVLAINRPGQHEISKTVSRALSAIFSNPANQATFKKLSLQDVGQSVPYDFILLQYRIYQKFSRDYSVQ